MALSPTIGWLFVGRVISGITASSIPTAMAYIADVVPKEKRAGAFGMIGVAFGVGFILGPGIGGPLADISPRLPFWVAARSEEHTSELQSLTNLVCRLLLEKKKKTTRLSNT